MLRGIWTLIVMAGATLVLGLLATVGSLFRPDANLALRLGRVWGRVLMAAAGIRPEYEGLHHIEGLSCCVFIANHQSMVDIWALMPVLPVRARFVAKRSLFRIPVLGWALSLSGFVPIDRERLGDAIRSLDDASRQVRQGRPFVLFAEGTRSRDGSLGPFKKGAFHVALKTRVPVVPVAISGAWKVLQPRSVRVTPGPVRVVFGAPLDIVPFLPGDVEGLRAAVRAEIARGIGDPGQAREPRAESR